MRTRAEWTVALLATLAATGSPLAEEETTPSAALLEFLGSWEIDSDADPYASLEFLDDAETADRPADTGEEE